MQVYLDMDGVLADFEQGARDIGFDSSETNKSSKELPVNLKTAKKEFYNKIETTDFYRHLPLLSDAKELWDYVSSRYDFFILTASPKFGNGTMDDPLFKNAAKNKYEWVCDYLGYIPEDKFFCTQSHLKHTYIKNHCTQILIDDRPTNIKEWNEAGGVGILHTSTTDSLAALEQLSSLL